MSKNLFQLIKSLSPTEKRYFKVNAVSNTGSKNYIRLFEVIDKMEVYEDRLIRKKFDKESFLENLHVNKNYLYQVILRTLRGYYEKKSTDIRLHNLLIDVIILNQKGQYRQAEKLLQRVKKVATKYDNQLFLLAAIRKEINLSLTKPKKLGQGIAELCQTLEDHLKIFDHESQIYILRSKLTAAQRAHFKLTELDINENIADNPLLQEPLHPDNFYSTFLFHRTWSAYYHLSKQQQLAFEHYHKIIELWESHPHFVKDKPYLFKIQLSNFLCICHELSQYKNFSAALSKIKSIPSQSFDEEAETFQNVAYYELLFYMNTMQFDAAQNLIPIIKKGLERYSRKVNKARLLAFWYNITILFFALEKYEKALDWLTNILNEPRTEHRQDIQFFARFLELVFHFELKNNQVFDYLLRSLLRVLQQSDKTVSSFEILLANCLKKLPTLYHKTDFQYLFQDLQIKLNNLPLEDKKSPGQEEISLWVETKVSGFSFLELMRRKYNPPIN